MMIDFHTHVLPGIDDGSRDLEMSAGMIREEFLQGTQVIVATPHFYANRMAVSRFLDRRAQAFDEVCSWRAEQKDADDLPQLLTGAEVYYFQGMGRAEALPDLCIRKTVQPGNAGTRTEAGTHTETDAAEAATVNTRTLLLEMPFEQWTQDVLRDVKEILHRQDLTVVLAHIERYIEFQKDRSIWEQVFDLPVIPQINAGSFLHTGGLFRRDRKRRFCMQFLEEHPRLILGSDAHNLTSRAPNLAAGRKEIADALGEGALQRIDETTREVLGL